MNKVFYALTKKTSDRLSLHKKQDGSKLMFKADFEQFDFSFQDMLGWASYPNYCFAVIIDNKIVSCASAGYHANKINNNIIDVTVATHNDYRGYGYAVSNLVALCEYALSVSDKKEIHYMTCSDNISAQKTAISAGMKKTRLSYIMLRKLISNL